MPTVGQDISEIRQTVYGRDMREPIADACVHLRKKVTAEDIARNTAWMEELTEEIEAIPGKMVTEVNTKPLYTTSKVIYQNVEVEDIGESQKATVIKNYMTISDYGDFCYKLTDTSSSDLVKQFQEESYIWNIDNPIDETVIVDSPDYIMYIKRKDEWA